MTVRGTRRCRQEGSHAATARCPPPLHGLKRGSVVICSSPLLDRIAWVRFRTAGQRPAAPPAPGLILVLTPRAVCALGVGERRDESGCRCRRASVGRADAHPLGAREAQGADPAAPGAELAADRAGSTISPRTGSRRSIRPAPLEGSGRAHLAQGSHPDAPERTDGDGSGPRRSGPCTASGPAWSWIAGRLRATLYRSGRRIWRSPIGVGKPSTPTPAGRFWIRERIKVPNPGGTLRAVGVWHQRLFGPQRLARRRGDRHPRHQRAPPDPRPALPRLHSRSEPAISRLAPDADRHAGTDQVSVEAAIPGAPLRGRGHVRPAA